jgi:hypothetical protein
VEGWVEDALQKTASAEPVVVTTEPLPSLFDVPDAPTPVEGYVPPVVVKDDAEEAGAPAGGATPAAALKAKKEPKKAGGKKGGMTVAQLKEELKRRGLARTGKKAELEARLQAAVDAETAATAEHGAEDSEDDAAVDETDVIAVAPPKLAESPTPTPPAALTPVKQEQSARVKRGSGPAAKREPELQPELQPELPSAVDADDVLAAMTGSEDSDSDDDAFEDVFSPGPGDQEEHDWEVTAIVRQPAADEDWGATATIPISAVAAVAEAVAAAAGDDAAVVAQELVEEGVVEPDVFYDGDGGSPMLREKVDLPTPIPSPALAPAPMAEPELDDTAYESSDEESSDEDGFYCDDEY